MKKTKFTELVGSRLPIQVAPMGGITTPELGGAVVGAGGHAMFGLTGTPAPAVADTIAAYEGACGRNYGVNFLVPFLDMEVVKIAASTAPLVEIYHGDPDEKIIRAIHEQGALASWQVTSSEEAVRAADLGCDLIVAHGIEAGGRMPGGIGLLPLLEQVARQSKHPRAGRRRNRHGARLRGGSRGWRRWAADGDALPGQQRVGRSSDIRAGGRRRSSRRHHVHQSFQRTLAR
jgi:NAD(P)H-dependent flavin oxidoreductase YrpB (nitropropane dioxygenase family)